MECGPVLGAEATWRAQARVRELSDEVFELRSAKEARDAEVLGLQERMQRVVLKSDVSSVRTELAAAMAAAAEAEAQVQRLSRDVAVLKNKAEQAEEARGRTEADLTAARAEISVNEAAARALGPLRAERDRLAAELRNTQARARLPPPSALPYAAACLVTLASLRSWGVLG